MREVCRVQREKIPSAWFLLAPLSNSMQIRRTSCQGEREMLSGTGRITEEHRWRKRGQPTRFTNKSQEEV